MTLLVFMKYPEPGKVKTRLAASIGGKHATALYRCFVDDIYTVVKESSLPLTICFWPAAKQEQIKHWLPGESYHAQNSGGLGVKLQAAFVEAFKTTDNVVVIGSDAPDLPVLRYQEAFAALDTHDAVIGPAVDGGYYLLGMTKKAYDAGFFEDIPWSTNTVFEQTMAKLKNLKVKILSKHRDVDTLEELQLLWDMNQNTAFARSKTMSYLFEHSYLLQEENKKKCS